MRHIKWKVGLCLSLISTFFSLVVAETVARIWHNRRETELRMRFWHVKGRPDNAFYWVSPGEYFNIAAYNSEGYHDYERFQGKSNLTRIEFLGDSFVEAKEVKTEEIFYNRLTTLLNKDGSSQYETFGLGRSGNGFLANWNTYRILGKNYHPDYVGLVVCIINDFENDYYLFSERRGYLPDYALGAEGYPILFKQAYPEIKTIPSSSPIPHWNIYSTLLPGLHSLIGQASQNNYVVYRIAFALRFVDGVSNRRRLPSYYEIFLSHPPDYVEGAFAASQTILERFFSEVRADGVRPFVILLPSNEQIHSQDFLHKIRRNFPESVDESFDLNRPNRILVEFCTAKGIPVLDMLPKFKELPKGNTAYYLHDGHLNPLGHEYLAKILYQFLTQLKQPER